jgi:adenylate kinase
MHIVLLGTPGSGKGTQGEILAKDRNFVHLSSGELLRTEVKRGGPLGIEIKSYLDKGLLVPSATVTKMVLASINSYTQREFLLDGYPRTLEQAHKLDEVLRSNSVRALFLSVNEEEVLRRLMIRAQQLNRSDDTPETLQKRLEVYRSETYPLLHYYRDDKRLIEIDATGTINEVSLRVRAALL